MGHIGQNRTIIENIAFIGHIEHVGPLLYFEWV